MPVSLPFLPSPGTVVLVTFVVRGVEFPAEIRKGTTVSQSVDSRLESVIAPVADVVNTVVMYELPVAGTSVPAIVIWMVAGALAFTFGLRALPWRSAGLSFDVIRGRYTSRKDPGELTSLQSLMTDLGGAVGLGNIAGVAIAITIGGPGATLWIMAGGLVGMAVKMAEATLGVKYRTVHADGTTSGGAMYYLRRGLKERGTPRLGKFLAGMYALCAVGGTLGAGALFQSNQSVLQIIGVTGGEDSPLAGWGWALGTAMAVLAATVLVGGITWIGKVSSKLVTVMAVGYLACCIIIIIMNWHNVPASINQIFSGAFTGEAAAGGAVGAMIIGVQRAFFSNGAGNGNSATAHSAVRTSRPATEGFVAMWGSFVDSVIVCTMTALAIVVTGVWQTETSDGVALTSDAFATVSGVLPILLTIFVLLFAFSTLLAHSYYGKKALGYLFGDSKLAENTYTILFLAAIIFGAAGSLGSITALADSLLFMMTIPNLIGLYILMPVVRSEIFSFRKGTQDGSIEQVPEEDQFGGLVRT